MFKERKALLSRLEENRHSKVVLYVTGDRPGLETQISAEVYDLFVNHLDLIGVVPKISLFLYTRGGDTLSAWSIVNLIRQFCSDFEVVVPSKCHSAGTLISLGANRIVMTKQATLGPIDPSITTPLNPQIPGAPPTARLPVSVEAINGFLELAKDQLRIQGSAELSSVLNGLTNHVHPLVLGEVYRSKSQIQMLARKLVGGQVQDTERIEAIVSFLCSESGSHDYTIHRREARNNLKLTIETPDDVLYSLIKNIYDDIANELQLNSKLDINTLIGAKNTASYSFRRGLLESFAGGSNYFVSEGVLTKKIVNIPGGQQVGVQDERHFEGWKHDAI